MSNDSLAERLEQKLRRLSALLIILWVIALGFRPMMDNVDLGWHVAQGRWMVHHFSFYRHDAFNYPNLGHPVINEYPLFQVILYAAWSLGWWGPCLLTCATYGLLAALFLCAAANFNLRTSALFCLCIILMFFYLQVAFPLRPHLVTYLGIAVLGIFLLRHRDVATWTEFWPMAILQIAWVNSHSGFVIGPVMVGLFGFEMSLRRWFATRKFPIDTAKTWLAIFALILLACFFNPSGWARFALPFYQDQLESIRAYVGEMEPLSGGREALFSSLTIVTVNAVVLGLIARWGSTAYSFLLLGIVFYFQAQSVQKAWPVFGVFIPLVILASGAFSRSVLKRQFEAWINVGGHFTVSVIAGIAILLALNGSMPTSIESQWREYDHGRSELSLDATAWMKAHGVTGRLFHRCEDGGYLQQEGFDEAQTFSDTGFGKYDEAFIHEIGLVNERPAFVPHFISAYKPDFVVCSNFCYQWPYYLRLDGWRLIFYSPNSSVWTRPETRPDLPTVTDDAIKAAFDSDLTENGIPVDATLLGRNLIALNSLGLEDYAFAKLTGISKDSHTNPWYWEAARILCFAKPPISAAHRQALFNEATSLHEGGLTAEFRAYCLNASGDIDGALKILKDIPPGRLTNAAAELLVQIELGRKDAAVLGLARRTECFDLRNGKHWQYLAQAEEQFGSVDAARAAWQKAVFYYPDDDELMKAASDFAAKYADIPLKQAILTSAKSYGLTESQP